MKTEKALHLDGRQPQHPTFPPTLANTRSSQLPALEICSSIYYYTSDHTTNMSMTAILRSLSKQKRRHDRRRHYQDMTAKSRITTASPFDSSGPPKGPAREERVRQVAQLRAALRSRADVDSLENSTISTGFPQLDALLPQQGLRRGWLVEWLTEPGSGGSLLALQVAHHCLASCSHPVLVVIDPQQVFDPPAAVSWGIPVEQLLIVQPRSESETWWVWEEVLRSPVFPVAWGFLPHLPIRRHRRLQLACETGNGWGMLLRSARLSAESTWSAVQWQVEPLPSHDRDPLAQRRWRVSLLRCRGCAISPAEVPTAEISRSSLPSWTISEIGKNVG